MLVHESLGGLPRISVILGVSGGFKRAEVTDGASREFDGDYRVISEDFRRGF